MKKQLLMALVLACSLAVGGCGGTTAGTSETAVEESTETSDAEMDETAENSETETEETSKTETSETKNEESKNSGEVSSVAEQNTEAFSTIIDELQPDQAYALVDMGATADVLLVTDYTYEYEEGLQAAIAATVYGLDGDGSVVEIGKVESAGTAYPLAVSAEHYLYYGSGHGVSKAAINSADGSLEVVEEAHEEFDSDGNATDYFNGEEVKDDTELTRLYDEWYNDAAVIPFTVIPEI